MRLFCALLLLFFSPVLAQEPKIPQPIREKFQQIRNLLFRREKLKQRAQYYRYFASKEPKLERYYLKKAKEAYESYLRVKQELQKVVEETRKLAKSSLSENPVNWVCLGNLDYLEKKYEQAIEKYRRYFEKFPNGYCAFQMSRCYIALGQWMEAKYWLEKALQYGHPPLQVYSKMAEVAFCQGQYDEVLKLYRKMLPHCTTRRERYFIRRQMEQLKAYQKDWEEEQRIRKKEAEQNDLPRVKLITSKGVLIVELFEDWAPNAVANFLFLVENQFYNGTKFFRMENFFLQGGDPTTSPSPPEDAALRRILLPEKNNKRRRNFPFTIAVVRTGKHLDGYQFLINLIPNPRLDGKCLVFGRVIQGQEVLFRLKTGDILVRAEVLRKRSHPYKARVKLE